MYFYNAHRRRRFALERFIQADTIVPSPANPQSLNRYSYVLNNALKYTDPTGHRECEEFCDPSEMGITDETNLGDVAQEVLSTVANTALSVLTKGAFPRIETGPEGRKAEWNLGQWPFYNLQFEVGHKSAVRTGESPWLVKGNTLRHYSPDGNVWTEIGYNPLTVAESCRISLISSNRSKASAKTEIRFQMAAKIEDWKLHYEAGAGMAFGHKIPGAEGRDVYYVNVSTDHHLDREGLALVGIGLAVAPQYAPIVASIFERVQKLIPVYGQ